MEDIDIVENRSNLSEDTTCFHGRTPPGKNRAIGL